MSTRSTEAARAAAINSAYDVATDVAERPIDADDLALIQTSLDSSRSIATGETSTNDLDKQFAEAMAQMFLDVRRDGPHTGLWRAVAKQVLALGMLTVEEIRTALLRGEIHDSTRWADLGDGTYADRLLGASPSDDVEPEPWDVPDDPAPALSEPQTGHEAVPQADVPPTPQEASEADDDVIDAEVVEVGQTTTAQRRYKMPPGQHYSPGVNPLARPIGGGHRPVIEISTSVPGLDDQR